MLVIHNIGQLVTCEPMAKTGLGIIANAALVAVDDIVSWYGPQADMPPVPLGTRMLDAQGMAVFPGFIDSHTHLLHVGDRSREFAARAAGKTYLEIAAMGGGILSTVDAVHKASEEQLVAAALPRLRRALERGITTIEIKSGYGLNLEDELKMLRVLRILSGLQPIEIISTFLGAHTLPLAYRDKPEKYVDLLVKEMLPEVSRQDLARFCDVYVEQGAFSVDQARRILSRGLELDLQARLHTDQFNSIGGCALAAELQAISADHLEAVTAQSIKDLASADVVACIMPLCEVYLGKGQAAPGRALVDAGLRVAVASDFNPGSANAEDLLLAATLSVTRCGLSVDEAILGITRYASSALARDDIGRLHIGTQCDLVILDTPEPYRIIADMGAQHVNRVVKSGRLVYNREEAARL